jgi:purine-nucleoside phosphorylase
MAAHQMGITTFAISVITDECDPEHLKPVSIEEIIATAQKAEPAMTQLMCKIIENLPAAN